MKKARAESQQRKVGMVKTVRWEYSRRRDLKVTDKFMGRYAAHGKQN